ncbi:MAG: prolyl oligopeptidase family serine peptidase [Ignavibacteriales bacterium]|nr:prolyl oligopeptidase family serine peptidase [Ignavibacteriales bacterium]
MFGQLASWGFVVFASMYRASFNNELHDEFGGSDVDDILNLMEIANDIPFADTSRWAMEGWSRGGMMTYLTLRKRHDVKAAIISGGITDVAECCLNVPRIREALQQLVHIEGNGVYEKRSAIHFADELPKDCKYLIIRGTKDETVSPTPGNQNSRETIRTKTSLPPCPPRRSRPPLPQRQKERSGR